MKATLCSDRRNSALHNNYNLYVRRDLVQCCILELTGLDGLRLRFRRKHCFLHVFLHVKVGSGRPE